MKKWLKYFGIVVGGYTLIIGLLTMFWSPEISGVIIDAKTKQPINGARVFGRWRMTYANPGGKKDGPITKELTLTTGTDGKFVIPSSFVLNLMPFPFGQGGYVFFMFYSLGYDNRKFYFEKPGSFASTRNEFADRRTKGFITIELNEISDAYSYSHNSLEIYDYVADDHSYQEQQDRLFLSRFGHKRWDSTAMDDLAKTYAKFGNYSAAERKIAEYLEDNPNGRIYYGADLVKYKKLAEEHNQRGR